MSDMPVRPIHRPREIGYIRNIADTLESIKNFSGDVGTFSTYRGHGSLSWGSIPNIFRKPPRVLQSEYLMVRDLVSRYPESFMHDKTMFDRLVRMQHFGLPTRLLDVTGNPLVALYFATADCPDEDGALIIFRVSSDLKKYYDSDSISCVCNLANLKSHEKDIIENTTARTIKEFHKLQPTDRLYQFIREEKPHFLPRIRREDLCKPYYVVAKLNNPRIIAQSGAFLAFGLKWSDEAVFKDELTAYSLRIPRAAKADIQNELGVLGINAGVLFPEIDKAAAQIEKEYS